MANSPFIYGPNGATSLVPGGINLPDSSGNLLQIEPASSTTPYTVKMPSAQGSGLLVNDGSGNLSWSPGSPVSANIPNTTSVTSFTFTITATTTNPTPNSATMIANWKQDGEYAIINYFFQQSATGTAGSGDYIFSLPSGFVIDSTKQVVSTSPNQSACGYGTNGNNTGDDNSLRVIPFARTTTGISLLGGDGNGTGTTVIGSSYFGLASAAYYSFTVRVPIIGFTASTSYTLGNGYVYKAPTVQKFLSTGTTTGYLFTITSATLVSGDTYTNNGNTYTILNSGSSTLAYTSGASAPTSSGTLTRASGSGPSILTFSASQAMATYTTPSPAPLYIRVRMVGGGGGGGGSSNNNSGGGTGGAGSLSVFGSSLLVATGGGGGPGGGFGGGGATASLGSGPIGLALGGGAGGSSGANLTGAPAGANGASSPFGGEGGGGPDGNDGIAAIANTGSGGGGAGTVNNTTVGNAAGGGAGGFIDALITSSLSSTYYYSVGTGGAGGTAGTSGHTGGAGGSGLVEVTEYYQ